MEANYIPRIFDGDVNFIGSKKADSSKWNAIHKALDNPGSGVVHSPSSIGSLFRVAWILGIVLGLTWIMRNGRTVFTQWQQNMYRRANRRRHGIPDSDNRPFNIAYAAAALAKREKQRAEQEKAKARISSDSRKSSTSSLRSRQPMHSAQTLPNTSNIQTQEPQELNTYYPVNRPLPGGYPLESQEPQQTRFIQLNAGPTAERRSGHAVQLRSRGERDFVEVNGERDIGFPNKHIPRRGVAPATSRGYKRQVNDEDNWEASLDKRARMGSASYEMDVEKVPASIDSEPSKGTKRDREELESTPDSGADETDESPQPRRIRQRREPVERKEARNEAIKAHKRRHSLEESTASEERDKEDAHVSKQRRKVVMGHDTTESEAEDMQDYSEDPACVGRKIGEVWEVNGQTFKVGLDGQRLRQVLVKQRRSKFPMPRDSIHSDVIADMEVFVEKWLNDQEYKAAKENSELAWQNSPSSTATNGTMELRQSTGKRLLWDGPPKSPVKGRKSMHPSSVQNPFDLVMSNASRRASSVNTLAGHAGDNPQLRTSRSFSKWEKQDLEALSLKKMRERMEKEKKEQKPDKPIDKVDGTPLPGDGKFNFPAITPNVPSSGLTLPSAADKQTGPTVSLVPTPSTAPSTSAAIPTPGITPTKPALLPAKDAELKPKPSSTPAAAPSFAFNNVGFGGSKTAVPAPSPFNFGAAAQPPSTAPTSTLGSTAPVPSNTFPFNAPTTAPAPVQGSKSETSSSMFNFQSSTATGSTAPKTFNFPTASTGPSATAVTPTTGSTSTDFAKTFSFAPPTKSEPTQPKAAPTPGLAPTGFNFTSPVPSSSETQKNIFGNPPKPANEPTSRAAASSASSTTAPTAFTFGSTPLSSQPTSGPSASDKPIANTIAAPPAFASAPTFAPTKPAESQSSTSLFGRLGPQSSTQSLSSSPSFGGSGAQATKPDQIASKPSFTFGAKEPSETARATTPNVFASFTPSGEQPKATTPNASEPQKFIFGSQANTSSSKSTFGAPSSPSQSPFGTPAFSEPTKNVFGQPSQPVSAFGPTAAPNPASFGFPSQPNLAPAQSSEPKNVFGQTSEAKSPFGQTSQVTNASNQPKSSFGQPSESKSAFTQPNLFGKMPSAESSKPMFGQTPASEPTKSMFGQTPTATTDAPKNPFGQGFAAAAPKSAFGQPSEPPKPTFGQPPTSSSTASFGIPSTSASSNTLSSSGSTSNQPTAGNTGFAFTFGGGGSAPPSFTGFGGVASENKQNALDQPKATGSADTSTKPTSVFGQPSGFGSFPASTSTFGSGNTLTAGSPNQPSGSTTSVNPSQQPGASTSTTQTTSPFNFNFSEPS